MNREEQEDLINDFNLEVPKDIDKLFHDCDYELNLFHKYVNETRNLKLTLNDCDEMLQQHYCSISGRCDREGFYE